VLAQPGVQAIPGSGPAGVNVTLRGFNWPANRAISYGLRSSDSTSEVWMPNQIVSDGAGNFSVAIFIGPEYREKSEVRLLAYEPISTFRMEAGYRVTQTAPPTVTPRPAEATVAVSPNVLAVGQVATVTGQNWQAGAAVSIGVGRPGFAVEEWLTSVAAGGNRSFATQIVLSGRWQNAGQLVVTALNAGGKIATTTITVIGSTGRIVPAGMPMTVSSYGQDGRTLYKVNAQGWQPGKPVTISVISADGSINSSAATSVVNENGIFAASFYATAPWVGRADLGVRAITVDGQQYSLRYLPNTSLTKINGGGNNYNGAGTNWPANTPLEVVIRLEEGGKNSEGEMIHSLVTDANGSFNFTIELPRFPGNSRDDVEIRAKGQPYSAVFDF
jgi:hypothetical protein